MTTNKANIVKLQDYDSDAGPHPVDNESFKNFMEDKYSGRVPKYIEGIPEIPWVIRDVLCVVINEETMAITGFYALVEPSRPNPKYDERCVYIALEWLE